MIRQTLKKILIFDEGKENKAYTDTVGKITIGVGRNLTDKGLSDKEIEILLDNDISDALQDIYVIFGTRWGQSVGDYRLIAIASMLFNLGKPRFLTFKKMREALKNHDFELAAAEALDSKWAQQVGKRAERLAYIIKNNKLPDEYL